jgi:hypothetical protein
LPVKALIGELVALPAVVTLLAEAIAIVIQNMAMPTVNTADLLSRGDGNLFLINEMSDMLILRIS